MGQICVSWSCFPGSALNFISRRHLLTFYSSVLALGIINGVIDELIQAPYYPEFARYNTYGIESINQTIYDFMKTMYYIPNGCRDRILECAESDIETEEGKELCSTATDICRSYVEEPYYTYGERGEYAAFEAHDVIIAYPLTYNHCRRV